MGRTKKNKIGILFFAVLIITLACNNAKNKDTAKIISKEDNVIELIILYENLTTQTFTRVACNELEQIFDKVLKKKILKDKSSISEITESIDRTVRQGNYTENIDVRFKMILIYQSKKSDTICGNGSVISVKNKNYRIDKDFTNLLKNLTDTE
ncbi:hypothetical protein DHD32_18920 [Arenibacter sp. TNZ]|uniref:hypothetical protein n=1 Tax=Arenibacter TaxID=178469 RepID=UPI000CD3D734|nr:MULTISPECIES: hypothetical protein [Arenibacter]MCM4173546.1 hypothetical protein [Arenibacter sp. TNZ]MCM4173553.1 hypothetical protein [Arenibacter sp. TNZ]